MLTEGGSLQMLSLFLSDNSLKPCAESSGLSEMGLLRLRTRFSKRNDSDSSFPESFRHCKTAKKLFVEEGWFELIRR